jgi:hypothetical protein
VPPLREEPSQKSITVQALLQKRSKKALSPFLAVAVVAVEALPPCTVCITVKAVARCEAYAGFFGCGHRTGLARLPLPTVNSYSLL